MNMAWIWTILLTTIVSYILKQFLVKKKNLPPGPPGIPILGHFHLLGKLPHRDFHRLAEKYGPIMSIRFGFVPTIIVSSPAAAKLFLKTHDIVMASRPPMEAGKYLTYGQKNLILSPYGQYWRDIRKLCTLELLSTNKINQFRGMRKNELGLVIETIKCKAESREAVDLSKTVLNLISDMNCLLTFGRKFVDEELNEKGFKTLIRELVQATGSFNLGDYFPYVGKLDLQGWNSKLKDLSTIFDGFFEKMIDDHEQSDKEKRTGDFVDTLLDLWKSGRLGFEFDRRHVKAILLDLLISGNETSSTTVEWTLSEILKHPEVMKKLQNELESVVGLNNMVEESHIEKLEYLNCVLKEGLRLHPPAPLSVPHASLEDCEVNNYHVPKNSRILVNLWAIGRDPKIWSDPDTFSPERFIGSSIDLKGQDFELLPFGSGRRMCPGLNLGLIVAKLLMAQIIHCFDWELPNGTLPENLDMSEVFGAVVGRSNHLMAIPKYRLLT